MISRLYPQACSDFSHNQARGALRPASAEARPRSFAGPLANVAITFGLQAAQRIAPQRMVEVMIPLGVLIYASTGVATARAQKNFR